MIGPLGILGIGLAGWLLLRRKTDTTGALVMRDDGIYVVHFAANLGFNASAASPVQVAAAMTAIAQQLSAMGIVPAVIDSSGKGPVPLQSNFQLVAAPNVWGARVQLATSVVQPKAGRALALKNSQVITWLDSKLAQPF